MGRQRRCRAASMMMRLPYARIPAMGRTGLWRWTRSCYERSVTVAVPPGRPHTTVTGPAACFPKLPRRAAFLDEWTPRYRCRRCFWVRDPTAIRLGNGGFSDAACRAAARFRSDGNPAARRRRSLCYNGLVAVGRDMSRDQARQLPAVDVAGPPSIGHFEYTTIARSWCFETRHDQARQ